MRRLVPLEMGLARAAAPHAAEAAQWRARRRPHAHILEGGLRGEGVAVREGGEEEGDGWRHRVAANANFDTSVRSRQGRD